MKRILAGLREVGLEGPRVAVALLPLVMFALLYLMQALLGPDEFRLAFFGLALCYFTSFFALASGWFWARWLASGLAWSGALMGVAAMVLEGWNIVFAIFGGLHALVIVMLMGPKMVARFDLQPGWRQRFGMDEFGVARLNKAVTRASAALPSLIFWAFGPPSTSGHAAWVVASALALLGLRGLVRLRTWGVLALGGSAMAVLAGGTPSSIPGALSWHGFDVSYVLATALASVGTAALAGLLLAATMPFLGAAVRYYRALR